MNEQPTNPIEAAPARVGSEEEKEQRADDYIKKNVEPEEWREQS